jgi:tRNA-2-methylthio-N6-dimethylallyladenosine synthase
MAREVEFDNAYIFKYSRRKDTPAAEMAGQLSEEIKEDRHARLLALVNEIAARHYDALIGKQVQILVEGPSRKNPARQTGRTRCNQIVLFEDRQDLRGQLVNIEIERTGSFTLYGKAIPEVVSSSDQESAQNPDSGHDHEK